MTLLTTEQAKLISLGMNIQMRERKLEKEWLSEFQEALFDKYKIQAEKDYFDFWFELNREDLENKFIVKMLESWEDEDDAISLVLSWSQKFTEYCWEKCFANL